jgi:integrase
VSGSLHVLRHTHATLALTNGVPVHVAAARIGDRPETVLRVYAHLLPQSDVEGAEQVAALIA